MPRSPLLPLALVLVACGAPPPADVKIDPEPQPRTHAELASELAEHGYAEDPGACGPKEIVCGSGRICYWDQCVDPLERPEVPPLHWSDRMVPCGSDTCMASFGEHCDNHPETPRCTWEEDRCGRMGPICDENEVCVGADPHGNGHGHCENFVDGAYQLGRASVKQEQEIEKMRGHAEVLRERLHEEHLAVVMLGCMRRELKEDITGPVLVDNLENQTEAAKLCTEEVKSLSREQVGERARAFITAAESKKDRAL